MAYRVNPGRCIAGYYTPPTASCDVPRCCAPCGKAAYPKQMQDFEHIAFKKKYKPFVDLLKADAEASMRHEVENRAHTRKIVDNTKFKMKLCAEETNMDLERRRDLLKQLLECEDEAYADEVKAAFENRQTSRLETMRTRVQQLKSSREQREKEYVEKKYEQAFQNQCEQMRSLLSKRMSREIALDWNAQLEEKQRLECEVQDEERLWAYLSNKDVEEKWRREQAVECIRAEAVKRGLEELNRQMELKKLRLASINKIKARERALIEADIAALKAEEAKYKAEKEERFHRAKAHVEDMLATRNYYRDKKLKREEIVAREFLKKAVRELYIEQEDRNKAKREMMRAVKIYTEYLQKRDCLANTKEDAVQRFIDQVIEEQYEKVMASRTRDRQQRRKLFETVMAGRAHQIQDLKKKQAFEEDLKQKELQALKDDWKRYVADMEIEQEHKAMKQRQYRCDLDSQVSYENVVQDRKTAEIKREDELCDLEEKLFNHRLQKTLQEAELTMSNPYRQPLVGKCVRQCLQPVPNFIYKPFLKK